MGGFREREGLHAEQWEGDHEEQHVSGGHDRIPAGTEREDAGVRWGNIGSPITPSSRLVQDMVKVIIEKQDVLCVCGSIHDECKEDDRD